MRPWGREEVGNEARSCDEGSREKSLPMAGQAGGSHMEGAEVQPLGEWQSQ